LPQRRKEVCFICFDIAGPKKARAPWVRGTGRGFSLGRLVACPPNYTFYYAHVYGRFFYSPLN
jgi:hypothetical protein